MLNLKHDFPSLYQKDFSYLDTASSAQKPQVVIDAMADVMENHYANIHRGLYDYSQKTTSAYEAVREKVRAFINAQSTNEIVFTRNTVDWIITLTNNSYHPKLNLYPWCILLIHWAR